MKRKKETMKNLSTPTCSYLAGKKTLQFSFASSILFHLFWILSNHFLHHFFNFIGIYYLSFPKTKAGYNIFVLSQHQQPMSKMQSQSRGFPWNPQNNSSFSFEIKNLKLNNISYATKSKPSIVAKFVFELISQQFVLQYQSIYVDSC